MAEPYSWLHSQIEAHIGDVKDIRAINYAHAQRIRRALNLLEVAIYRDEIQAIHRQLVEINHAAYCIEANTHCQGGGDESPPKSSNP